MTTYTAVYYDGNEYVVEENSSFDNPTDLRDLIEFRADNDVLLIIEGTPRMWRSDSANQSELREVQCNAGGG